MAQTYTIKKGDTLYSLGKQNGVSVKELQSSNGITNPNALKIGQQIKINSKSSPSTPAAKTTTKTPAASSKQPSTSQKINTIGSYLNRANGNPDPSLSVYQNAQNMQQKQGAQYQQKVNDMMAQGYKESNQLMAGLSGYLSESAAAQMKQQEAALGMARDQKLNDLAKAYETAIMEGKISVRDAEEAYRKQEEAVNAEAYQDAQRTNEAAQARGLQNSQQMMGMVASDNARKNSLLNENMTQRDRRIADISDRINNITLQKDLDTTMANSEYNYGKANAEAAVQQNLSQNMFNMTQQQYMNMMNQRFDLNRLGLQNDMAMNQAQFNNLFTQDNMALQNRYTQDNMGLQQMFTQDNMGLQQGYDLQKMDVGQRYTERNMGLQQGYDLQKMGVQQGYTERNMGLQHGYTLKEMGVAHGYDLEKMATQQGYDLEKMDVGNQYTLGQMMVQQNYDLTKMDKQYQFDLGKMTHGSKLNIKEMGVAFNNDMSKLAKQYGYDSALADKGYQAAAKQAEKDYQNQVASEQKAYEVARSRELAKYTPGTAEYKARDSQLKADRDAAIQQTHTQMMYEATMGALFKDGVMSKPAEPKYKKEPTWYNPGSWNNNSENDKKRAAYERKLAAYNEQQSFLSNPGSFLGN